METVNPKVERLSSVAADIDEVRLRDTISALILRAGGVRAMSSITDIPKGTLEKYAAKTSTASLLNAAKIAAAMRISLDGIVAGDREASISGGSRGRSFDQTRLEAAIEAVEEGLDGRRVTPKIKAELTIAAYDLLTDSSAEVRARVIRLVKG